MARTGWRLSGLTRCEDDVVNVDEGVVVSERTASWGLERGKGAGILPHEDGGMGWCGGVSERSLACTCVCLASADEDK